MLGLSLRKKRCMKIVGACFEKVRRPCLCCAGWAKAAAVPQHSAHGSCCWISWKINTRTGSHSRETSACAAAGAPRASFPCLVLVLWGWAKPQGCRESAADSAAVWVAVSQGVKCMKWSHTQSKAPGKCIIYHPASCWCLVWS